VGIRTALGASRARIAGQFFAEALVLSSIAAACGLAFAMFGLRWVKHTWTAAQGRPVMFWWNDDLSPTTLAYASVLAIVAALIVGVTPALKATGRRVHDRLKQMSGSSSSGLKFGGVWTTVIVTQVAVTVIFLAIVGTLGWAAYVTNGGERPRHFRDAEYIGLRLLVERAAVQAEGEAEYGRRVRATYEELARRIETEPAVAGVTYATRLPGTNQLETRVEVEGDAPVISSVSGQAGWRVRTASVGANFTDVFRAPVVAGRTFSDADLASGRQVAIVDGTFARLIAGGRHLVGRRIREVARQDKPAGPWIEVVGVIRDLTDETNKEPGDAVMYLPAPPETVRPLYVAIHTKGNPSTVMPRLGIIGSEVDPTLRLIEVDTMDRIGENDPIALDFFARLLAGVSAVALLLATAGVYALMSFTVARREQEIGIRLALGASPGRIVRSTFSRALAQVALGLIAGGIPALALIANLGPEVSSVSSTGTVTMTCLAATCFVAGVTALACVIPARRALLIQPTDAIRRSM
jgi:predicted permease